MLSTRNSNIKLCICQQYNRHFRQKNRVSISNLLRKIAMYFDPKLYLYLVLKFILFHCRILSPSLSQLILHIGFAQYVNGFLSNMKKQQLNLLRLLLKFIFPSQLQYQILAKFRSMELPRQLRVTALKLQALLYNKLARVVKP